ncbi:MAG: lipopolysaccharide biosynthesis protein [Bacteroidales bacterium]|nr:lipopolysaccharide biosynthesis protein [Bacteroidales bacterium]MDD4822163.1 lipopolysaccharide biosynthesis protein [Bacteroidales bacterium]
MAETLKEKTTKGVIWSFIDKFGQQILYLLFGVVLARIVSPSDYGLIGVLSVFIAISNTLIDSGFNRGLLNKKSVSQDDYNSVFYFNLIISIVLYVLFFFCAPWIAAYFHAPQLITLSRVVFLAIPFNAISSIQNVIQWKALNLKIQATSSLIALILSSVVAVVLALMGFGVWALVAQSVLLAFGKSIVLWYLSRWRPTLTFHTDILVELFPFGSKLLFTGILNGIFNNIYSIVIGRLFPMKMVGFYDRANRYQDMCISTVSNTFRSVSIPLFSEVKDDPERLHRVISKIVKTMAFLIFPLVGFLITVAKPLLVILISDIWLPSVPLFQILCGAGLLSSFNFIFNEAVVAKGRSDIFMGLEIAKKIILLLLIYLMVGYGVDGLAYSWLIYSFINLIISIIISDRLMGYTAWYFIKDIIPYLLLSLVISSVAYYICTYISNYFLIVLVNGSITALLYLGSCHLFRLDVLNEIQEWMQKFKHRNK